MKSILLSKAEQEMIIKLKGMSHPCLFGAGKIARRILEFCLYNDIKIDSIIVSSRQGNPMTLYNIPVILESDITSEQARELEVVVALSGKQIQWIDMFLDHPFKMVTFLNAEFLKCLYSFHDKIESCGKKGYENDEFYVDMNVSYAEPGQFSVIDKKTGSRVCRICKDLDMPYIPLLYDLLNKAILRNQFLGEGRVPYEGTRGIPSNEFSKNEIYVMTTEKDGFIPTETKSAYCPLQVGSKLALTRKNCKQDSEGDSISEKNRNYSECTGLYWIWKNTRGQRYIGLEHYRRRLGLDKKSIEYIEENNIDFVTALPQFTSGSVKEFFMTYLSQADWETFKNIVIMDSQSMKKTFEEFENGHFYLPCNVGFWKRDWFNKYCEFAFRIAFKIEEYYFEKRIVREDRFMGYFFECMHTIYVMANKKGIKTAFADIEYLHY